MWAVSESMPVVLVQLETKAHCFERTALANKINMYEGNWSKVTETNSKPFSADGVTSRGQRCPVIWTKKWQVRNVEDFDHSTFV